MKKLLIALICVISITACKKNIEAEQQTAAAKTEMPAEVTAAGHIGDPNRTPDLYIPENELGWNGYPEGMGLRTGIYRTFADATGQQVTAYPCWIANNTPFDYTGKNDFVVCRPCDGIPVDGQQGSYDFPGMLSITTFQNGLPVFEVIKQRFFLVRHEAKNGFNWIAAKTYGADTMFLNPGTADNYVNRAKTTQGKQLVVVEINPDLLITESNYQNNVSTLPININGTETVLDLSAIDENKTHAATDLTGYHLAKNIKKVFLQWHCPYHSPFYVKHWFTIYKNGVLLEDHVQASNYVDDVSGAFKQATYEVFINVPGLGRSAGQTITIKK